MAAHDGSGADADARARVRNLPTTPYDHSDSHDLSATQVPLPKNGSFIVLQHAGLPAPRRCTPPSAMCNVAAVARFQRGEGAVVATRRPMRPNPRETATASALKAAVTGSASVRSHMTDCFM